jgi:hypothetical protein
MTFYCEPEEAGMAAESSPLLSGADVRRATSAQQTRKIISMILVASAVVVLLVATKVSTPTELVQWVVPKAVAGPNVATSKKMSYIYVQSAALQYDKTKKTEVFNTNVQHSSKLTPVNREILLLVWFAVFPLDLCKCDTAAVAYPSSGTG